MRNAHALRFTNQFSAQEDRSSRRDLLRRVAASGLSIVAGRASAFAAAPIRAIAFDAFPILDPRPVFAAAREIAPGQGDQLASLWRARQFEYAWLRSLTGRYVDFWQVTEQSLLFAARALKINLTSADREKLMSRYLSLRCWPEVPEALLALKNLGFQLAFLSNMTGQMLNAGIENSRLQGLFHHVLSTDRVRTYKPDPRAYQMGVDAFGLKRDQILFAAFAGWDAAGAKTFGYPTYWVNRENQPSEELGAAADATGANLQDLLKYVTARGART